MKGQTRRRRLCTAEMRFSVIAPVLAVKGRGLRSQVAQRQAGAFGVSVRSIYRWMLLWRRAGLAQLAEGCQALGFEFVPSVANFMLIKVGDGARVFADLQQRGVIVRPVNSYGLPEWIRVTVGTREQNERLLAALGVKDGPG